jgi:DNA-binding MarR family transcriptional regulator
VDPHPRRSSGIDPGDLALADELVTLAVRLTRRLRAMSPAAELTGPEISVLAVLVHGGRMTSGGLARLEEVRSPTITRLVGRLESRGLVRRIPDSSDRRVTWVEATAAGEERFRAGHARRVQPLAEVLGRLEEEDRRVIEAAMPVLRRVFDLEP